jgi:hypothetical protein
MALEEEGKVAYLAVGFQEAAPGVEKVVEAC